MKKYRGEIKKCLTLEFCCFQGLTEGLRGNFPLGKWKSSYHNYFIIRRLCNSMMFNILQNTIKHVDQQQNNQRGNQHGEVNVTQEREFIYK